MLSQKSLFRLKFDQRKFSQSLDFLFGFFGDWILPEIALLDLVGDHPLFLGHANIAEPSPVVVAKLARFLEMRLTDLLIASFV